MKSSRLAISASIAAALTAGCVATTPGAPGVAAMELDPGRKGPVSGVGLESHDIVAMSDQMMRDILSDPHFTTAQGQSARRPRVIIDSEYFTNESSQPINRNLITQRLLVNLNRTAQSRMIFVNRARNEMVEQERERKRTGRTDGGTNAMHGVPLGADYRLSGRIGSLDSRSSTGTIQRYMQITFELTDLETGALVWTGIYEFSRAAADDVVYR